MTRGCRDSRLSEHDLMGQHRRENTGLYQLQAKSSQSPFHQNDLKASQIQGSGRVVSGLWDGCVKKKKYTDDYK